MCKIVSLLILICNPKFKVAMGKDNKGFFDVVVVLKNLEDVKKEIMNEKICK